MDCEHKLYLERGDGGDTLTYCLRCGHWFSAFVTDDGVKAWRPFEREPVNVG